MATRAHVTFRFCVYVFGHSNFPYRIVSFVFENRNMPKQKDRNITKMKRKIELKEPFIGMRCVRVCTCPSRIIIGEHGSSNNNNKNLCDHTAHTDKIHNYTHHIDGQCVSQPRTIQISIFYPIIIINQIQANRPKRK